MPFARRPSLTGLLTSLLLAAGGCAPLVGNGDVLVEERELRDFDAVHNTTSLDVEITLGDGDGVRVVCDSNLLDDIEAFVDGGVLWIDAEPRPRLQPRGDCRVEVDIRHLRVLDNSGSGHVQVIGEAAELAAIHLDGSGEITVDELTASAVDIRSASSGRLFLAGSVRDVTLLSSGSGEVQARELLAESVMAHSRGSAPVELHASESLTAELDGSGDVHVWGEPGERETHLNGSGQVVFH